MLSNLRIVLNISRNAARNSQTSILRKPLALNAWKSTRLLSTTSPRLGHGLVDRDLAHKLDEELSFEREEMKGAEEPEFLRNFKERGSFKLKDTPEKDEVILTRSFGNEKISVKFYVSDINNAENANYMDDEDVDYQKDMKNEEPEELNDAQSEAFPVRIYVTIEKPGKGALALDLVTEEKEIGFQSIMYYPVARIATENTVEAEHERGTYYAGPQFGHLDEDLQILWEKYLGERGIDSSLVMFINNYIEHKEQNEYAKWLQNVKGFISA